jgi:uncharacterized membrane protein
MTVLLFVLTGLAFVAVSIPMIRRRVPPNPSYGLRVPATFADEWVWYEANARSGRDCFLVGVVTVVAALLLAWVPGISEPVYIALCTGLLLAGTLGCAWVGTRRANRLLAERRSASGGDAPEIGTP